MKYPAQSEMWKLEQAQKNTTVQNPTSFSNELARFSQFFPLTLFPDELIIEDHRVVLIDNKGPWTNELISIMATDIACVNSSTGPLFGHVHVKSLTGGPEIMIDRLWKSDVSKIRNLIEGIALMTRKGSVIASDDIEVRRDILLRAGTIS